MENLIQKDLFRDYIKEISAVECRGCGEQSPKEYFALLELEEGTEKILTCLCVSCSAKRHMLDIRGNIKEEFKQTEIPTKIIQYA